MRTLLLSLALLPALLLAPSADAAAAQPAAPVHLQTFRDREYRVQVRYPRGWHRTEDRAQGDLRVQFQTFDDAYALVGKETIYAAIFLGASDAIGKSLDEIVAGFRQDPPEGYVVGRVTKDKLGRLPAKRVVSTATLDGVDLTLVSLWAVRGDRTYSLMLSVPTSEAEVLLPLFEKIRKNFIARAS